MAVFPALFGLLMAAVVTGQMVDISPREAVRKIGEQLQVICRVPYPIDSCRMSVGGVSYRLKPGDSELDVVYFGSGLADGECGALFKNIKEEWNGNITCVLPPQTGSSEIQATMRLVIASQMVDISPREAVRKIGEQLQVICRVPYPIDSCRMSVGGVSYRLKPGDSELDVVYFGSGLADGECGALFKNIKEEWNGNITCVLPPQTGSSEIQATMRLAVAKAPKQPVLLTSPQPAFKEGDVFMAQCVAEDGRPAAKISWLLDDEELLAGVHQPIITTPPGSDLQTISQNVSRTLSADDTGRTLTCRVEHEALPSPYDMKRQLVVHSNSPPTPNDPASRPTPNGPASEIYAVYKMCQSKVDIISNAQVPQLPPAVDTIRNGDAMQVVNRIRSSMRRGWSITNEPSS